jgi:drug/metabolite transporter (DMT)-like permease
MSANLLDIFEQSDGSQWFFASGVVLGFAGNLVIWALAPVPLQSNWKRLLLSGACFVVASAMFWAQGRMLEQLDNIARSQPDPSRTAYLTVKKRIVSASLTRLITMPIVGLGFAIAGFAFISVFT